MKKFAFRLDRVMDWRQAQLQVEKAKLERIFTEIRGIDDQQAALLRQRAESEQGLLSGPAATGLELAALDSFRRFSIAEHSRLATQRTDCRKRIAAQIQAVAAKRRDVRLLERLRERRLKLWEIQLGREIDHQADEAYLAKWRP